MNEDHKKLMLHGFKELIKFIKISEEIENKIDENLGKEGGIINIRIPMRYTNKSGKG